ncbi:coiled-coil-helix-coiled-coil-helix domain-containing protein 1-like isoform X2 [Gigantopelta aegis]|uniref:coiled-coil-helix-coiled-coil-helix domain-containing protein 1-like isoform X2 n=1 Tax=Gigantopelta aegis TaxID=1735272 RepID=UPI001B88924F|nr:coiled-coil-helix-coiled-coil-helix domain-containing protein 1-like isoform X2 [Gigantopelta aegis]
MTKLTDVLYKYRPLKKFSNYKHNPVTYKIIYPPILKDSVSNKKVREKSSPCGQEMMLLLSCWRKNDFLESKCSKEIVDFNNCVVTANANKSADESTISKTLTSSKINKLLRRYPQPPHTIKMKD